MVTIEVNLKDGDEAPEQHLDDGEFIERKIVPVSELYNTLQGKSCGHSVLAEQNSEIASQQRCQRRRARLWTPGKSKPTWVSFACPMLTHGQALPLGSRLALELAHLQQELTC